MEFFDNIATLSACRREHHRLLVLKFMIPKTPEKPEPKQPHPKKCTVKSLS
jgi:hypothetical protein